VDSISINSAGFVINTSRDDYHAKVIIGADGSKGATRKIVNGYKQSSNIARVIETVSPVKETEPQFAEGFAIFDLTPSEENLQGYYWEFPSKVEDVPSLNRGVYDARIAPMRDRADLPGILEERTNAGQYDDSIGKLQGHPLHWFSPLNRVSISGLLLVGDAAGVDPLFGEGIGPALAYGKLAAVEVNNAFQREDFSFRFYRLRLLASRVGRYLLLRWLVAWVSYHLNRNQVYMHALWFVGKIMSILWPKPGPLYTIDPSKGRNAGDQIKSSAD
jgi:flavin-dependent dehydrogenase